MSNKLNGLSINSAQLLINALLEYMHKKRSKQELEDAMYLMRQLEAIKKYLNEGGKS